jgi:hypothetical protein
MRNNVAKKVMKFQEPPLQHSPCMPRVRSTKQCPLTINNHASGVGAKSSKQVGSHIAKRAPSSGRHLGNTWVGMKKIAIQKSLVEGTKNGSKALMEYIDLIKLMNL